MKPRRAWAAPAVVAAGIAAAVTAPGAFAADPRPNLPHRSAAQLIAAVEHSRVSGMSGSFRTVADLGLPKLPGSDGGSNLWEQVLTGVAQWHLWMSGPTRQRVALLGLAREFDAVDDVGRFWTWDSTTQTATREIVRLPASRSAPGNRVPVPAPGPSQSASPGASPSPIALAHQVLHALGPTTRVLVGPATRVAGRPAYTLDLLPRTAATLIGRVRIAVDAARGLPLQVALYPRSGGPAFTTEFTSLGFGQPPAAVFRFRPPPGARIRTVRLLGAVRRRSAQPRLVGSGWSAVLVSPGKPVRLTGLLSDATRPVPGGRLLEIRVFSVLLGTDGRTLVGAVPPERLQALDARSSGATADAGR